MRRDKKKSAVLTRAGRLMVLVLAFVLALMVLPWVRQQKLEQLSWKAPAAQLVMAEQRVARERPAAKPAEEEPAFVVCLDPGHGGNDGGSVYGERKESDDVLVLTKLVKKYLEKANVKVVMTRGKDQYVSLEKRAKIANKAEADFFVSIHRNLNPMGCGVETWTKPDCGDETEAVAQAIQSGIVKVGVQQDRGVKHGTQESPTSSYYVLRNTTMPGVLIELGFIDNPEDNCLLDQNQKAYAKAIAQAILNTQQKLSGGQKEGAKS